MTREYPRLGQISIAKPQGLCVLCKALNEKRNQRPEKRVHVQYNWFRGDDYVYKVHDRCIKGLSQQELLSRLT